MSFCRFNVNPEEITASLDANDEDLGFCTPCDDYEEELDDELGEYELEFDDIEEVE